VHLATNFMNKWFDAIPDEFRTEIYAWLVTNAAGERKAGMTDQQFYYKTRKNAVGPFKPQSYALSEEAKAKLTAAWEAQFDKLFNLLGLKDTRQYVEKFITPVKIAPDMKFYLGEDVAEELADDLSD
jgi:fructose-bisphosphate aldolase class II